MQESSALTLASDGVNFRNNFPVCVYMTACNDDKGDNFRLFPFSVMRFLFNAEVFSYKINFTSHFLSCLKTKAEKNVFEIEKICNVLVSSTFLIRFNAAVKMCLVVRLKL